MIVQEALRQDFQIPFRSIQFKPYLRKKNLDTYLEIFEENQY